MLNELRKIAYRPRVLNGGHLTVLAYAPLGLALGILRLCILFHIYVVSFVLLPLPNIRRYVLRCMILSLGWLTTLECPSSVLPALQQVESNTVIVSNYVTLFDHLMLDTLVPCYIWNLSPSFHWFGRSVTPPSRSSSFSISSLNRNKGALLHLTPDGMPSGDSEALFQWKVDDFTDGNIVIPVAVRVTRALPLGLVCYPLRPYVELLWHVFCPYSQYRFHVLPPLNQTEGEERSAFLARVRAALLEALSARSLPGRAEDMLRLLTVPSSHSSDPDVSGQREPNTGASGSSSSTGVRLGTHETVRARGISGEMRAKGVSQVQEVLPHMPVELITRALNEFNDDIHAAISHLLVHVEDSALSVAHNETSSSSPIGKENLTSSAVSASSSSKGTSIQSGPSAVDPSMYSTAASTFSYSAESRQLSFSDRKARFMANARQRYLQQHPEFSPSGK